MATDGTWRPPFQSAAVCRISAHITFPAACLKYFPPGGLQYTKDKERQDWYHVELEGGITGDVLRQIVAMNEIQALPLSSTKRNYEAAAMVTATDDEPPRKKAHRPRNAFEPSPDQQAVIEFVRREKGHVFITGDAGCGKSRLLKYLLDRVLDFQLTEVTASTGCAAAEIAGRTLHSFLGMITKGEPLDHVLRRLRSRVKLSARIRAVTTLVIDEISMIDRLVFERADAILREVRADARPFGGVRLILVGDFLQLPPVAGKDEPPTEFAFESPLWSTLAPCVFNLAYVHRQRDDLSFARMLAEIRRGRCCKEDAEVLRACVGREHPDDDPVTHIYTTNADVDAHNRRQLVRLKGKLRTFEAEDYLVDERHEERKRGEAFLRDIRALPSVELKVGAQVMCLRNWGDTLPELVNGSIGVVRGFRPIAESDVELPWNRNAAYMLEYNDTTAWPVVDFGDFVGELLILPAEWQLKSRDSKQTLIASRDQLPLMLCWAMSAHKSQGQTITTPVVADLKSAFAYGQAYVMLSRVKLLDQLSLKAFDVSSIKAHPKAVAFYDKLESEKKDKR